MKCTCGGGIGAIASPASKLCGSPARTLCARGSFPSGGGADPASRCLTSPLRPNATHTIRVRIRDNPGSMSWTKNRRPAKAWIVGLKEQRPSGASAARPTSPHGPSARGNCQLSGQFCDKPNFLPQDCIRLGIGSHTFPKHTRESHQPKQWIG